MKLHIALLRAINLPSHNQVSMADLRALLSRLGMQDPQSLLQSGNLVFGGGARSTVSLEKLLEEGAAKRLGLRTGFFVRTAKEWQSVIADNPFPKEARRDPGHLLMMALKDAPPASAVTALQDAIRDREEVRANGRHAYIVYPDGVGRSRLTMALIEKALGTTGTARNWNTVLKLEALTKTA